MQRLYPAAVVTGCYGEDKYPYHYCERMKIKTNRYQSIHEEKEREWCSQEGNILRSRASDVVPQIRLGWRRELTERHSRRGFYPAIY